MTTAIQVSYMSVNPDTFFNELKDAVESDRILLPSLPEVALKIRDMAEDEATTSEQIVDVLAQDSSMSARLLKVVNSSLYPTSVPIDDLQIAVTRMGIQSVRDMVMNLAMKNMYQPTSVMMEKKFRQAWNTSVEVAAICEMMASTVIRSIRKEQALLAGLIHNIGILPILLLAENDDYLFHDEDEMDMLVMSLQGRVGAMMLENWNFPDDLVTMVRECYNFEYSHEGGANLVDLVQFALLQGGFVPERMAPEEWSEIPAFVRLGADVEVDVIHLEENQEMLENTRHSLAT